MLITIYNNDNKHSFQTDFKSNLILPVNTELKLTNAYIALSHEITIPELTIVLSANGSVPFTDNVVVPAGTYSLQSLADTITNLSQIVADNNNMSLKIDMTYDSKKGYSSGCFKLDVEALSTLANIFQALDISKADYNDFEASIATSLLSSADVEKFIDSGVSYLGGYEKTRAGDRQFNRQYQLMGRVVLRFKTTEMLKIITLGFKIKQLRLLIYHQMLLQKLQILIIHQSLR